MNFGLFDSHCHLQSQAYDADRGEVLSRMSQEGMGAIVVGTDRRSSRRALEIALPQPNLWASMAVHPGQVHAPHPDGYEPADVPAEEMFDAADFAPLADSPKIVGVGETGLDYYRLAAGAGRTISEIKERQRENFSRQIEFALKRGLPLIMHVRGSAEHPDDAFNDAFAVLAEQKAASGVMHCFSGSPRDAERALSQGFHVSFAGNAAFPAKKGQAENPLAEAVRLVPDDRLLIETDAPYLAPPPFRGERNEPAHVRKVAEAVARYRRLETAEICRITSMNAVRLFCLADRPRP